MKFLHEIEDCLVGLVVGVIIMGLSGYYFSLPEWNVLWGLIFGFSGLFTITDFIYSLKDLGNKILPLIILFLNNLADIAIEIALAAFYLGFNVPYLSNFLNPFLEYPYYLWIIGIFFTASSIFWIIATPIIWREDKR